LQTCVGCQAFECAAELGEVQQAVYRCVQLGKVACQPCFDLLAEGEGGGGLCLKPADDVVVVGDSQARRLFKDALQVTPALLTPLIYILQTN
jgi:hypothetical protein